MPRNLQRTYQEVGYSKLFIFMGELEPSGKEKSIQDRTDQALADLEDNLRTAASGYAPKPMAGGNEQRLKDLEAVKRDGWVKASRNAFDLCEEMENLYVNILPRWEAERTGVQEVLRVFTKILEEQKSPPYQITLTLTQATKQIYGGGDQ